MSEKNHSLIGFRYVRVITEQFAVLEEDVMINEKFGLQTQLRFGINSSNKILAIYSRFRFDTKDKPFLVLETSSQFKVEDENWEELVSKNRKKITFPKSFIVHLSMLSVGTARGILHARTENTIYNHLVLPTVNIDSIVEGNITLELRQEEVV